jgi:hypothetical protein
MPQRWPVSPAPLRVGGKLLPATWTALACSLGSPGASRWLRHWLGLRASRNAAWMVALSGVALRPGLTHEGAPDRVSVSRAREPTKQGYAEWLSAVCPGRSGSYISRSCSTCDKLPALSGITPVIGLCRPAGAWVQGAAGAGRSARTMVALGISRRRNSVLAEPAPGKFGGSR